MFYLHQILSSFIFDDAGFSEMDGSKRIFTFIGLELSCGRGPSRRGFPVGHDAGSSAAGSALPTMQDDLAQPSPRHDTAIGTYLMPASFSTHAKIGHPGRQTLLTRVLLSVSSFTDARSTVVHARSPLRRPRRNEEQEYSSIYGFHVT
jgi:hypothetical protein